MKLKKYIITIITGILTGIITVILQKYLPINLNFLANSASMWLIPAFLIPYCFRTDKKDSIILSIISLILSVLGYYIFESIFNNHSFEFNNKIMFWLICAVVGGFAFGLGANYSNTKENNVKYVAMNLLPAVFISEGLFKLIHMNDYIHMVIGVILQIFIGIILYFVINNKNANKSKNLLFILELVVLGTLLFNILYLIYIN